MVIRQSGSQVGLRHDGPPAHMITVPFHNPIKIGMLHGILSGIAHMRPIGMESIVALL